MALLFLARWRKVRSDFEFDSFLCSPKNFFGLEPVAYINKQVMIGPDDPWAEKIVLDTGVSISHEKGLPGSSGNRRPWPSYSVRLLNQKSHNPQSHSRADSTNPDSPRTHCNNPTTRLCIG